MSDDTPPIIPAGTGERGPEDLNSPTPVERGPATAADENTGACISEEMPSRVLSIHAEPVTDVLIVEPQRGGNSDVIIVDPMVRQIEAIASAEAPAEPAPSAFSAGTIESIVDDFKAWLGEAKTVPAPAAPPSLDVASVLQHFIALRQEVNLQTRSSRAQLEQNGQAFDLLRHAHETMSQQQARLVEVDERQRDEALRPLLKTLIDAHDALSLARHEVQRLLENQPSPDEEPVQVPAPAPPQEPAAHAEWVPPAVKISLPFWARWLGLQDTVERQLQPLRNWRPTSPPPEVPNEASAPAPADNQLTEVLDALLTGYNMSLQRIERALQRHELETIPCAGLPFDPETMEVVEVVRQEGLDGAMVLDVVRNGYRWHDRLFRFAQVRVAKP